MGESRVENFKEYRKSMIREGSDNKKTPIDTSLTESSVQSRNGPTFQEESYAGKLIAKKNFATFSYVAFVLIVVAAIITFGFILF